MRSSNSSNSFPRLRDQVLSLGNHANRLKFVDRQCAFFPSVSSACSVAAVEPPASQPPKMRVLLLSLSVVCVVVLSVGGEPGRRYPRDDDPASSEASAAPADGTSAAPATTNKCHACSGVGCTGEGSACAALHEGKDDAADLMAEVKKSFEDVLKDVTKLTHCFTMKLKKGDKAVEVRDCGPSDVCTARFPAGKEPKGYTDMVCEVCERASKDLCNAPAAGSAPPPADDKTQATDGGPTEAPLSTTTLNKSCAYTLRQQVQGSSFYWMWMLAVALLFSLLM